LEEDFSSGQSGGEFPRWRVTNRGTTSVRWRGWGFRDRFRTGAPSRRGARREARDKKLVTVRGRKEETSRARRGGRRRAGKFLLKSWRECARGSAAMAVRYAGAGTREHEGYEEKRKEEKKRGSAKYSRCLRLSMFARAHACPSLFFPQKRRGQKWSSERAGRQGNRVREYGTGDRRKYG